MPQRRSSLSISSKGVGSDRDGLHSLEPVLHFFVHLEASPGIGEGEEAAHRLYVYGNAAGRRRKCRSGEMKEYRASPTGKGAYEVVVEDNHHVIEMVLAP
jgi:hypothetical protein